MYRYNGKEYYCAGGGTEGYIFLPVDEEFSSKTAIKYPVKRKEVKRTAEWTALARDYSSGVARMVKFEFNGKTENALEMGFIDGEQLKERAVKLDERGTLVQLNIPELSEGEFVLLYLMLAHCSILSGCLMINDTGYHNCMYQGKEELFRIFLIDMAYWENKKLSQCHIENFSSFIERFWLLYVKDHLDAIKEFMRRCLSEKFTDQEIFITELVKSCLELSDQFLGKDSGVHYHERIDGLLDKIQKDSREAVIKLKATLAVKEALSTQPHDR